MAKTRTYEQWEILTSGIKMGVKMYVVLTLVFLLIHILVFIVVSRMTWNPDRDNMVTYAVAKYVNINWPDKVLKIVDEKGGIEKKAAHKIVGSKKCRDNATRQFWSLCALFACCGVVYIGEFLALKLLKKTAGKKSNKEYIRGAKLITEDEYWKQIKSEGKTTDFPLGPIAMPVDLENRGTMFIGKPGVGKTQAMRPLVKRTQERKEKGIVYDFKGDYTSEFYNPDRNRLFNIADKRCLGWNIFNDLVNITDIEAQAASLIPHPLNGNPFWESGARAVFKAILHLCHQNNATTNRHIWQALTTPTAELVKMFKQVRGAEVALKCLAKGDSRQAEGVMAVLMQYVGCFEYMAQIDGDFSIKEWIRSDQRDMIFVTNLKDIEDTLRPILSLFIDLCIRNLLSLPDSKKRKLFFYLDELGTLQRIMVPDLLTTGRSKGACTFIGNQDTGRTEKIYGRQIIDSMDNALGNRITLCLTGNAAKKEAMENIGETEFWHYEKSHSMGPSDIKDGININRRKQKELLFLPSDLSNLPDLTGIVRLRNYDYVKVKWIYEQPQELQPPFILREDLSLEYIKAEQQRMKAALEDLDIEIAEPEQESALLVFGAATDTVKG